MTSAYMSKHEPGDKDKHPAKKPPEKQGEVPRERDDGEEG